jgi:hypothetical protein
MFRRLPFSGLRPIIIVERPTRQIAYQEVIRYFQESTTEEGGGTMGWMERIEAWFAAVAFAEADEQATALKIVGIAPREAEQREGVLETWSRTFVAAAFAEADCPDIAKEILAVDPKEKSFLEMVGLKGIRVWYGTAPVSRASFLEEVGLQGARIRFGVATI